MPLDDKTFGLNLLYHELETAGITREPIYFVEASVKRFIKLRLAHKHFVGAL